MASYPVQAVCDLLRRQQRSCRIMNKHIIPVSGTGPDVFQSVQDGQLAILPGLRKAPEPLLSVRPVKPFQNKFLPGRSRDDMDRIDAVMRT